MYKEITFVVEGNPIGKQRPKATTIGNFTRVYTPKETTAYESKVVNAYRQKYPNDELYFQSNEPICAFIQACFKLGKGDYGKKGANKKGLQKLAGTIRPTKKPDCDNIAKICLDALNGIAFYDDSQVVILNVAKIYEDKPYVKIHLFSSNEVKNQ